jgi:hypothetical protein
MWRRRVLLCAAIFFTASPGAAQARRITEMEAVTKVLNAQCASLGPGKLLGGCKWNQ